MWTCKTCNRVNKVDDGQCTWCCAYNAEYVSSLENKIDSLEFELAELRKDRERVERYAWKLRSIFHVNMLRAYPQKSHQEISNEIDKVMEDECGISK